MVARQEAAGVEEVLDPVCGMTISRADAVGQLEHRGQTYYFYSGSCLDRFHETPDAFLSGGPAAVTPLPGATYICPMDPGSAAPSRGRARSAAWPSNRTCQPRPSCASNTPARCTPSTAAVSRWAIWR